MNLTLGVNAVVMSTVLESIWRLMGEGVCISLHQTIKIFYERKMPVEFIKKQY